MSFQTIAVAVIVGLCAALAALRIVRFFRRADAHGSPCRGCRQCENALRGRRRADAPRTEPCGRETQSSPRRRGAAAGRNGQQ